MTHLVKHTPKQTHTQSHAHLYADTLTLNLAANSKYRLLSSQEPDDVADITFKMESKESLTTTWQKWEDNCFVKNFCLMITAMHFLQIYIPP